MSSAQFGRRSGYAWLMLAVLLGCSDSGAGPADSPMGGSSGAGSSGAGGGQAGSAGSAGSAGGQGGTAGGPVAGSSGAGGSAGTMGGAGGDAGACVPHTGAPVVDPEGLTACGSCGGAHCIPGGLLTDEQSEMLADCDDGVQKCVPDLLISSGGMFLLKTCSSLAGAEGRCLSTCVPLVEAQADRLPRDVCEDGELCAPCFDPVTGLATGACTQSCDEGPASEPLVFETCCDGRSVCVPDALVPEDERGLLGPSSCEDGELCAPKELAADPHAIPETCESLAGAEGRCLSTCLSDIAAQSDRLPQSSCDDDYLCAPCFDPVTGLATGACNVGDDPGPTEEPVVFGGCCDDGGGSDLGSCVPLSLVPEEQRDLLAQDTCEGTDLCAPIAIAAGAYEPVHCEGPGGGEARCLAACLPDIAAQAERLVRGTCAQGELCAPCYDPLTGESTGACELEGDEPQEDPYAFPSCCSDGAGMSLGTCVPSSLVPEGQASLLGADTCTSGLLCAPTPLATATYVPDACESVAGAEGRCLPACLPSVAEQADRLPQADCAQGELCTPCFDPLTGADTGACRLEGDTPAEPPYTFPMCCGSGTSALGTCVPSAFVSNEQAALLGQDTCGSGNLCAPTPIARGEYEPDVCQSWLGAEGRCLPACLPDVAAQASQLQDPAADECDTGELCVPCFDPVSGEDTGACRLEGDAPSNAAPQTFPACCPTPSPSGATRGTCVPARAAGAQASSLPNLSCETATNDADDYVCAPNEKVHTPNTAFTTCTTAFAGPDNCGINVLCAIARGTASGYIAGKAGVCVPSCFLSEQSTNVPLYGTYTTDQLYGQSTCATGEDCGPCTYPQGHPDAGDPTGLCN